MSFFVTGQPLTIYDQLTNNTAKTLYTATKRTTLVSLAFTETNGTTQSLSIFITSGGVDYYIRKALAVTAKQRVIIDETISLAPNAILKATSGGASGFFDVMVTYLAPDSLASR